jgi:hypothetical protein
LWSLLLNNFPALVMGGRKGVPWHIGFQSEESTYYSLPCKQEWHIGGPQLSHFRYISL